MTNGEVPKHSIAFIVPPPGDITMPMLGAYVLNRYLKKHGVISHVIDFSVLFYHNARLKDKFDKCVALSSMSISDADVLLNYKSDSDDKIGELVLSEELLNRLQDIAIFSAGTVTFSSELNSYEDMAECIENLSVFCPLIEKEIEHICDMGFSIIGLSVSFFSQLPFALLIANLIKKYNSQIYIVLGGSLFEPNNNEYEYLTNFSSPVDKVITGPGENILLSLCVPDSSLCGGDKYDIECIPDFSDVKWEQYYTDSQTRCIPFSFRTSCYYGKCLFCNGDRNSATQKLNDKLIKNIVSALRSIVAEYGITHVYFTDAAINPCYLLKIAKQINGSFKWGINARADKKLTYMLPQLASNGCSMLRIGFESGSQNVLNAMSKGTYIYEYDRFLSLAKQSSIRVHAYIMVGFPGETDEDRNKTLNFLVNNKERIYSYSLSIFNAYANTPIYDELAKQFGNQYNANIDINTLYYNEQSYNNILKFVALVDTVMTESNTNKYCFGGRVFMVNPSLEPSKFDDNLLSVIQNMYKNERN